MYTNAECSNCSGECASAWESKIKVIHLTWRYLRLSHSLALIRKLCTAAQFRMRGAWILGFRFSVFSGFSGWLMKPNNNNLVSLGLRMRKGGLWLRCLAIVTAQNAICRRRRRGVEVTEPARAKAFFYYLFSTSFPHSISLHREKSWVFGKNIVRLF